jgi:hypothetical protein
MTIHVGVDPGKRGGIATIFEDGNVRLWTMPVLVGTKSAKNEYDLLGIKEILRGFNGVPNVFFTVERSQPIPPNIKAGSSAQFHRGVARGWEWALTALEYSYQLVPPQKWQKALFVGTPDNGDTKQRAAIAVQRLFPKVDLRASERARKPHDGLVDALLLAEFGRRTINGGTRS